MDSVSSSPKIISGTAAELATLTSADKWGLDAGDYFIVAGTGDVSRWNGTSWDVVEVGGAASVTPGIKGNTIALASAASATGAQTELTVANGFNVPCTIVATNTGRGGADDTVIDIEVRIDANWLVLGTITMVGNETVDLAESISANVAWQAIRANITTYDNAATGSVTVTGGV